MKSIDLSKLKDKETSTISSEEALNDVEPFVNIIKNTGINASEAMKALTDAAKKGMKLSEHDSI